MGISKGHLPYRGEPQPKYPKRRKQFRNLKAERSEEIITLAKILGVVILLGVALFRFTGNPKDFLEIILIPLMIILPVLFAIFAGLRTINKFRKHYDVDVSGEAENRDSKQPEDLGN